MYAYRLASDGNMVMVHRTHNQNRQSRTITTYTDPPLIIGESNIDVKLDRVAQQVQVDVNVSITPVELPPLRKEQPEWLPAATRGRSNNAAGSLEARSNVGRGGRAWCRRK